MSCILLKSIRQRIFNAQVNFVTAKLVGCANALQRSLSGHQIKNQLLARNPSANISKKSFSNFHSNSLIMITFCSTFANAFNIAIFLVFLIPFSHSVNFQVSRFSPDVTVTLLEGDAVINSLGEINLTSLDFGCRVGRIIYNGKVPLWDSNSEILADFTSRFSFTIDTEKQKEYGNGIAFFLAPVGFQIPPNSAAGFLGLFNTSTTDSTQSQIVSIEFDSFVNAWDPQYEHVGINKNSLRSLVSAPWNVTLHSGEHADAWIVYNSTTSNLSVFWSYGSSPNSSLSLQINLKEVLPQWVTVGISASTGKYYEQHILQSWEFSSSLDISESDKSRAKKIGLRVGITLSGCILVAGAVVAAFVVLGKCRYGNVNDKNNLETAKLTSINEDLERGAGPRRFSYNDLALATNNFSDERKLGQGGFGGVYKGYLRDLDILVAVKKFSTGSKQGKKEYITEVKIISMLRHRNLVQLIGWCHDQGEFLLVYEFMPNGSLDYHLFGRRTQLAWTLRYKIAQGLASALLYLHEEWEQCVVHRDIKSSNVMLDSGFNAKLGDFGLARLMDHELGPRTTHLAGTFGYLAPEYISTRRASRESDVYSFGVVALEIATGRKSVDEQFEKGLVEWVWDLYGNGGLMSAMDERMQTDFDAKQVECLMIVGLWCAHPDRNVRPSIRQASLVLNFEADLPKLPTRMPMAVYHAPSILSASSTEPSITSSSINMGR
ncbi:Serine/threonine protein kinase [Handroanthus impetiginosus]|uniref:Serine/threonine protein kinase n=1 Tax=Handroanthus impetiginosus TaxID=429701 RepID=A0A2G9GEL0_9LAMI|nr:Serine/threonine protein kinase [Handroanthus impetiginosus]